MFAASLSGLCSMSSESESKQDDFLALAPTPNNIYSSARSSFRILIFSFELSASQRGVLKYRARQRDDKHAISRSSSPCKRSVKTAIVIF